MPVLQSHHLQNAEYDDNRGVMTVTFVNGATHEYVVPRAKYEGMLRSPSPGQYLHQHIRLIGEERQIKKADRDVPKKGRR